MNIVSDIPFSIDSIISISEIGVVHDTPLELASKLVQEYGLHYFSKGPRREDFVALGDDDGLLLISKTNRIWFPTTLPSLKNTVKIIFTVNKELKEITFHE